MADIELKNVFTPLGTNERIYSIDELEGKVISDTEPTPPEPETKTPHVYYYKGSEGVLREATYSNHYFNVIIDKSTFANTSLLLVLTYRELTSPTELDEHKDFVFSIPFEGTDDVQGLAEVEFDVDNFHYIILVYNSNTNE